MLRKFMRRAGLGMTVLTLAVGACAQPNESAAKSSLAPTGTLRAAINYGNAALAHRDASGALSGVSVDIARELGRRLRVPVTLVPYDAAGKVTAAASNAWDVAFLALDPKRAQSITFSPAYVLIDGTYAVRKSSPITALDQVDRPGIRVAVSRGSAYDLFLTRTLKHAELVRGSSTAEAVVLFRDQRLDVLAGVKNALDQLLAKDRSMRMLPQPFMAINQAMGTPSGRKPAAAYLETFIKGIKTDGFLAATLKNNGLSASAIAPSA
ncbi:transporter substrate-binding domain-containing protein [uncultured Bradyrhizobium sp.]|uniref:transporter substrate-binding domain-containing protein n=1 Tax=uncultured Bradyrhizobium sp. TaxID=199684 RepID=UPI0026320674|nr:transporter substrate-binding domain-containing protein [uncultured Bradyrhizobium sp.]